MVSVGSANLDWANLGFQVQPTDGHAEFVYKDGAWGSACIVKEPYMQLHVNSVALHYGQTVWEGLKAFHCKDGSVRIFNDQENLARLNRGADRMLLPPVPLDIFRLGLDMAVRTNIARLPPYGTGGSLYLRPILFGSGPQLGLSSAKEFHFLVIAIPVGNYYAAVGQEILRDGAKGKVVLEYDRAAPLGVGGIKCPGNYATDIRPSVDTKKEGYMVGLYLDAREQRYIEEFSVTNFVAITKDKCYLTPSSPSILSSITNKCLMQLARDMGLRVEQRRIDFLAEVGNFQEVAGVGTAAVVLPVKSLTMGDNTFSFGAHDVMRTLHESLLAVQKGEMEDRHGWTREVDLTQIDPMRQNAPTARL